MRWALAQLELTVIETSDSLQLQLPETDHASFSGQTELKLPLHPLAQNDSYEAIHIGSRFGQWLLQRLHALGPAVHVRPAGQPTAVNDITQRLFAAYKIEGGQIHLGGCQLTDYPFLRLTFTAEQNGTLPLSSQPPNTSELRHVFVAHDGSSLSDKIVHDLGLLEIEPILKLPPRLDDTALQSLITAGRRVAAQTATSRDPGATVVDPAVTSLIWVKHVSGKLHFTIDEITVDLPFSGWARTITAQPYTSPQSGASSFQLAATDDGRIDVAAQIAVCQQSGRRVLCQELVTCSVTGKHILEEFTEICPVSGKACLNEAFATCQSCQQSVSKVTLENNTCLACQQLTKIKKDDPRLVWILGEHRGLDRWNYWQLSETQSAYITQANSWTKRLKVVVDKETLAVHHLATASRFSSTWLPVTAESQAEILQ